MKRKPVIFHIDPQSKRLAAPPPTNYRIFLNSLLGKRPENLTAAQVNNWEDVDVATPEGRIIDEIAKKFNNAPNKLGIGDVRYNRSPAYSYYSMNANIPQLDLSSKVRNDHTKTIGPEATAVGHELVHANDHQIDQLNPRVWQNLGNLAKGIDPNNAPAVPMAQSNFFNSIQKIQKKIDPINQVFSYKYPMHLPKIEQEIANATGQRYKAPTTGRLGKSTDWDQLFNDINAQVTSAPPPGGVQNQAFHLPFASEFPAYMTENLTRPWGTNQAIPATAHSYGIPALSHPEARFLHSTLRDMDTAYPAAQYPTMNQHIRQRRNSIEQAYYPPTVANPGGGVPVGQHFSHGGRVKPKRRSLSSYIYG